MEELEQKVAELSTELEELKAQLSEKEKELEELRQYKENVERVKAEVEKMEKIKEQFKEAGIEKPEEYFEENRERLLSLDEAALEFMLQEMAVALAAKEKEEEEKEKEESSLPNFPSSGSEKDPYEVAKRLLAERKK